MVIAKVLVALAITFYISSTGVALICNAIAKRRIRRYRAEEGYKFSEYKVPYQITDGIYDAVCLCAIACGIWFVIS